uniref:restriction endonuclease subunit S n=1 Tax=Lentilactobacillus hilgardii TaxID=1588 RepID=UPI00403F3F16
MFPKNGSKFPQLRFSGFADAWEQRKLGELMSITSVKRVHQSDWTSSGIRFLRARDIVALSKGKSPSEKLFISNEKYRNYSEQSGKVQIGDLLVTGVGTIGIPLLINKDEPIYFKDGNIIWFKNQETLNPNYFYHAFKSSNVQNQIRAFSGIGTVGTYTIQSGKETEISVPTLQEQRSIGQFFQITDKLIAANQRKVEKLKELKKGYMQKMFC